MKMNEISSALGGVGVGVSGGPCSEQVVVVHPHHPHQHPLPMIHSNAPYHHSQHQLHREDERIIPFEHNETTGKLENGWTFPQTRKSTEGLVPNFRSVLGVKNIYRCSAPENVADVLLLHGSLPKRKDLTVAEQIILYDASLIVDLRSPSEIDRSKQGIMVQQAPGGPFQVVTSLESFIAKSNTTTTTPTTRMNHHHHRSPQPLRFLFQLDPSMAPSKATLLDYIEANWLQNDVNTTSSSVSDQTTTTTTTPTTTTTTTTATTTEEEQQQQEPQEQHGVEDDCSIVNVQPIYQAMNDHGLFGLLEFLVQTGQEFLSTVLKVITIHLEQYQYNHNNNNHHHHHHSKSTSAAAATIVFHCSIGKDRTGIVAMLLESILDIPESAIIHDFTQSSQIRELAKEKYKTIFHSTTHLIDLEVFAGAPPETMIQLLHYLQTRYGSIIGYLDTIGFDDSWRRRFQKAVIHNQ